MKLLLDFLPIIVFFAAFKLADIFVATGAAIAVTVLQLAWTRLSGRRIEPMQWVGLVIVVVFGGATLVLQDETFIKWKPTVLYAMFALALAGARLRGHNLLAAMLRGQLSLPDPAWARLNTAWTAFFVVMALLNLAVAYSFPTEVWVNYKLFGSMGLTFAFVIAQALYVNRHLRDERAAPAAGGPR